jgi:hypothetical protein
MDALKKIVRQVLESYAGPAANGYLYLTISPDETTYAVTGVGKIGNQSFVNTGILLRLVADQVIIERDQTDKAVVDALLEAGVLRNQIMLAYAGETIAEPL